MLCHLLKLQAGLCYLQAQALADKGAVFVDIRTAKDFAKEHIPGAVNVPLFVPVAGNAAFDQIKKLIMITAFAMSATGAFCGVPLRRGTCNNFSKSLFMRHPKSFKFQR